MDMQQKADVATRRVEEIHVQIEQQRQRMRRLQEDLNQLAHLLDEMVRTRPVEPEGRRKK